MTTSYFIRVRSRRPPFSCLAYFLWGPDADFDSSGNSSAPADPDWTELMLMNRKASEEQIDIHPVSSNPLILELQGSTKVLAARAAYYLSGSTTGDVSHTIVGPYFELEDLEAELGEFDLETAAWNAAFG